MWYKVKAKLVAEQLFTKLQRHQKISVIILKGSICLHVSKSSETWTGVCSHENKDLLIEEIAPCPESHVSYCSKNWLPDSFQGMDYMREKSLLMND